MPTVTIQEAQARLSDLIHRLAPGDEVVITENDEPVAKLARTEPKKQWPCKAGAPRKPSTGWPRTSMSRLRSSRSTWSEPAPRHPSLALPADPIPQKILARQPPSTMSEAPVM